MENELISVQDCDISDRVWNNYLKKYTKEFVLFLGEDRIWKIKCKFGHVEPFSLNKGLLSFYGKFKTPLKKTLFLKKISAEKVTVRIDGYDECVLTFYEKATHRISQILHFRKRLNLSKEGKLRKSQKSKEMWAKKKELEK